jgi:hypothetical protein
VEDQIILQKELQTFHQPVFWLGLEQGQSFNSEEVAQEELFARARNAYPYSWSQWQGPRHLSFMLAEQFSQPEESHNPCKPKELMLNPIMWNQCQQLLLNLYFRLCIIVTRTSRTFGRWEILCPYPQSSARSRWMAALLSHLSSVTFYMYSLFKGLPGDECEGPQEDVYLVPSLRAEAWRCREGRSGPERAPSLTEGVSGCSSRALLPWSPPGLLKSEGHGT